MTFSFPMQSGRSGQSPLDRFSNFFYNRELWIDGRRYVVADECPARLERKVSLMNYSKNCPDPVTIVRERAAP